MAKKIYEFDYVVMVGGNIKALGILTYETDKKISTQSLIAYTSEKLGLPQEGIIISNVHKVK